MKQNRGQQTNAAANQFSDPHGYNVTLADVMSLNGQLLDKGIQCDPDSIVVKSYDSSGMPESIDNWLRVKHEQGQVGEQIRGGALESVPMGYFANYLPLGYSKPAVTLSVGQMKQELERAGSDQKQQNQVLSKFFPGLDIDEMNEELKRSQGDNSTTEE